MGMGLTAVLTAVFAAVALSLSGAVAALERKSAGVPLLTVITGVSLAALAALAASALLQLGRPQLIFSAFSNPSSSIFRLGMAWMAAVVLSIAYLTAVHRAAYESTCRRLAAAAAFACVLILAAHAMNYVMPWRAAWNTWCIVPPFFGFAAVGAAAVTAAVDVCEGRRIGVRVMSAAALLTVLSLAAYLVSVGMADSTEAVASRVLSGDLAAQFWGCVVGAGVVVPCGLLFLARRCAPALLLAFVSAAAGCAAWQVTVLKLGSAAWSFFAR